MSIDQPIRTIQPIRRDRTCYDTIVAGDPGRTHGYLSNYRVVPTAALDTAAFDNRTDTWSLAPYGRTIRERLLVDVTPRDDGLLAVHGVPNRFRIPGPDTERQARYVGKIIARLRRTAATRVEARSRVRLHRLLPAGGLSRFYLAGSVGVDDEVYEGPAELLFDGPDGDGHLTRVRLTGHFDPIDGHYHWQGTIHDYPAGRKAAGARIALRVGAHTADCRVTEQTPWDTWAVIGAAGYPPFPLDDVEITMPPAIPAT